MVEEKPSQQDENMQGSPAAAPREDTFRDVSHYVPRDIIDISFPVSVRGYDRGAVEAYVKRVNRVIAEVKVSASPPAAVRHALDQAQEKVEALLQAARDAAEEITISARREAEENTARAKAEAADLMVNTSADAERVRVEAEEVLANAHAEAEAALVKAKSEADAIVSEATTAAEKTRTRAQSDAEERRRQLEDELTALQEQAQTRMRELQADTDVIENRRAQLLDDLRALADSLVELADVAVARMQTKGDAAEATTQTPSASDDQSLGHGEERSEADELGGNLGGAEEAARSSPPA